MSRKIIFTISDAPAAILALDESADAIDPQHYPAVAEYVADSVREALKGYRSWETEIAISHDETVDQLRIEINGQCYGAGEGCTRFSAGMADQDALAAWRHISDVAKHALSRSLDKYLD